MKNTEEAAQTFSAARRERRLLDSLPESCALANDDEALLVQRRIMELLGETIGGWKASLPQPRGLFVAPLPASTIVSTSPCPIQLHGGAAKIEPEIAFLIGHDLLPREKPYGEADVRDVIAETHVVLELIGSRFPDPNAVPFPHNLADCLQNQGLYVGPAVSDALDKNLESLMLTINSPGGIVLKREGRHPNAHPLIPLVWLANFLSGRKETLKAGQVVTTGSYAGIVQVPIDTPLTVEFGEVGSLPISFTALRGDR
jgi:2-keto-4-pentenoate hydratase